MPVLTQAVSAIMIFGRADQERQPTFAHIARRVVIPYGDLGLGPNKAYLRRRNRGYPRTPIWCANGRRTGPGAFPIGRPSRIVPKLGISSREFAPSFFLRHECASSLLSHFLRDGSIGARGIGGRFVLDPDLRCLCDCAVATAGIAVKPIGRDCGASLCVCSHRSRRY
jgi:hypothetical protein